MSGSDEHLSLPAIRPAIVGDAGEIARLSAILGYAAAEAEMAERLAALLPLPKHGILVAETGGRLLGWAAVEIRTLLVSGRKAELMGLVVAPEARRRGVGRALVQAAEDWVRAQGLDRMGLRSNTLRAESHPFYERLGYERTKSQHVYLKRFGGA